MSSFFCPIAATFIQILWIFCPKAATFTPKEEILIIISGTSGMLLYKKVQLFLITKKAFFLCKLRNTPSILCAALRRCGPSNFNKVSVRPLSETARSDLRLELFKRSAILALYYFERIGHLHDIKFWD